MTELQSDADIAFHMLKALAADQEIQSVLDLSNAVFEAEFGKDDFIPHTMSQWRSRLHDPRSTIIYITHDIESKIVGFFFMYPKVQPEIGFETCHIWLAGIDATYRGHNLFQRLFEQTKAHAIRCGISHLSVCTIPELFKTMYRILQKHGWEFVAWREEDEHKKVLMKFTLA